MRRVLAVGALAAFLLVACQGTNRPEGVVERWLISLNQGKAGQPEKYAPARVSNQILPGWQRCDPGALEVIEVGRHAPGTEGLPAQAIVPYRLKYDSDLQSKCGHVVHPTAPARGTAVVVRQKGGGWMIAFVQPSDPNALVPSEGGPPIGSATLSTWLLTIAVSLGLMLLVALLIRLTPKPAALPTKPELEARRPGTDPGLRV